MDWSALAPLVASAAPTIGSLLGGLIPFPGGAILGQVAGKVLAEALGVPATPEAVNTAITTGDPTVIQAQLTEAEAKMQAEVEKHKVDIEDVQDARHTGVQYAQMRSGIQWAPTIVSTIVAIGFCLFSYIAIMKPTGVAENLVMYLLAAWNSAFVMMLSFWLGSSSGSRNKDDQIAVMAGTAATASAKAAAKR